MKIEGQGDNIFRNIENVCTAIGMWWVGFSKLLEILKRDTGCPSPWRLAVCSALPSQELFHLDSPINGLPM